MKPSLFIQAVICVVLFWSTCMPIDSNTEWFAIDETTIRVINHKLVEDRLVFLDTIIAWQETKSGNPPVRPIRVDLSRIASHQLVFPAKQKLCEGDYLTVGKQKLEVRKIGKNIPLLK